MADVHLHLNSDRNGARVTYMDLQAEPAVGVGRLRFRVDIAAGTEVVVNRPLHLGGALRLSPPMPGGGYIGQLVPHITPLHLPPLGGSRTAELTVDVRREQLHAIEERRNGALEVQLEFAGYWKLGIEAVPFWNHNLDVAIEQSKWISVLDQLGYSTIQLIELDMTPLSDTQGRQSMQFFRDAQRRYHEGQWRLAVEALRQSLNALVGDPPDSETTEQDVVDSFRTITKNVQKNKPGYQARYEHARRALKFVADLGSHPEADGTTKKEARACLYMVAGLLSGWSER